MDKTCKYQRDGYQCVFGAFHTVRYHHLDNGENDAIGDAIAPPSTATRIASLFDAYVDDTTPTEPNPELAATGACVTALEDLPADAQLRVLAFLSGRFSNYIAPPERTRQLVERTVRRIV